MNIKKTLLSVFIVVLMFNLTLCINLDKLVEEQELKVEPNPLELHGSTVDFNISAIIPVNRLKKGYTYKLSVKYIPTNKEAVNLGSDFQIVSDKYMNLPSNPKIDQGFSFGYTDDLESGNLALEASVEKEGKEPKVYEGGDIQVAKGIITTCRLVRPSYYANFIPSQYKSVEEYEKEYAEFMFLQGKSNLRKSEEKGKYGKQLVNYVLQKTPTRSVNMTGMHSPEGSETVNSRLAQERPQSVENFFKNIAGKYDYKEQSESINFTNKPVVQDWEEFKKMLVDYNNISETEKNKIFSIIDGAGDFVSKELKLQTLSSYRRIFKDIYPKLRTARAEILKIREKKTDPELVATAQKIIRGEEKETVLTVHELNYAGDLTPSLEERKAIYSLSIKRDDQFYAYNNLGATYLAMAKNASSENERDALIDKAVTQLELSIKKQENPEAYVNLAGIKLMKGDIEGAMEAASKVSVGVGALSQSINAIKGYVHITTANYDEAISTLSAGGNDPIVLYNKALAYLLKSSKELGVNGYEKAKIAFDEAIAVDQNNAYAYYGAAIVGARMGDTDQLIININKAAELSSDLKTRAVNDLEFAKYFDNEAFKTALK